jgi:replicative DNA helicase
MTLTNSQKALGLLFLREERQKEISKRLLPDFFELEIDKQILSKAKTYLEKNLTVSSAIFDEPESDYLTNLMCFTPIITEISILYEKIKEDYLKTSLERLKAEKKDFDNFIKSIKEIQEKSRILEYVKPKTIQEVYMEGIMKQAEENWQPDQQPKTGIASFDKGEGGFNRFYGFRKGELVSVGALSGSGKSTLVFTLLKNLSKERPCVFYSLEMSSFESSSRVFSQISKLNTYFCQNLGSKQVQDNLDIDLTPAFNELEKYKIYLDDDNKSLESIITNVRALKRDKNIEFVFIDFLQIVKSEARANRSLEIGFIVRELKNLAMELGVVVILLSQLNNASQNAKEPSIFDMKESGDIASGSDLVFLMWKDNQEERWLKLAKDRNGGTNFKVKLNYNPITRSYE